MGGLCSPMLSQAQNYPSKNIRFIVSDSAGGLADTVARILANALSEELGQRVVVENHAGAGSNIGAALAAKSAPDGYTWYEAPQTMTVNAFLYKNLPYDFLRDFSPVTRLGGAPALIVVHPSLPVYSLPELVSLAKRQPSAISFASAGTGTPTFLSPELFKRTAGIHLLHVPYRGGGEAITAVLTGETPLYFAPLSVAMPQVRSGRLRALAITSAQRLPLAPQWPTVAESGYPGFESGFWWGLMLPVNTSKDILRFVHATTQTTLKRAEVSQRLKDMAFTTVGDSPEEFATFIRSETQKWGKIIRELGLNAN